MDEKIKKAKLKANLALVPLKALYGAARVFSYGAKKYQAGNFLQASMTDGAPERYVAAAFRHFSDLQEANGLYTRESLSAIDVESGLPEIDHIICGLLMLRSILIKEGVLPKDPGEGREPPSE